MLIAIQTGFLSIFPSFHLFFGGRGGDKSSLDVVNRISPHPPPLIICHSCLIYPSSVSLCKYKYMLFSSLFYTKDSLLYNLFCNLLFFLDIYVLGIFSCWYRESFLILYQSCIVFYCVDGCLTVYWTSPLQMDTWVVSGICCYKQHLSEQIFKWWHNTAYPT